MPIYGSYETVKELYRTGRGSVWSARKVGSANAVFAIKLCTPDVDIAGREHAEGVVALFLEQAQTQQRVAAAGEHWAPIHEFGPLPAGEAGGGGPGAYSVSDLFDRQSAQRLISLRVTLDSTAMHRLIAAAVAGLRELQRSAHRPHGNLKPANVLVAGTGALASARVALADPLPDTRVDASTDALGDIRALGDLIFQLVLRHPFREMGGWPVPASSEWSGLGRHAEAWRDLCNRLLVPNPGSAGFATLDEVEQRLAALVVRGRARLPRPAIIGAVCVLLVAGAIGGYIIFSKPPPRLLIPSVR